MGKFISVAEYARMHGKHRITVAQKAAKGHFVTAQKIGRMWVIDKDEPYPHDKRYKE